LDAVGVAPAEPFISTRVDLETRKAEGLHGGMAFTYRNPARSTTPASILPEARALVVGARSYWRPARVADRVPRERGASIARYAWTDHYAPLRAALTVVADRLREDGWQARMVADDNALVDREAAARAGIGWYGKNANLLLPGQGSWFVLGSVVTDAPLADDGPPEPVPDGCGTCHRCLDGCPTGAIVAPGVVDARRCLAWLLQAQGDFPREFRVALGDRIYGCDDCQEVCPPNKLAERRASSVAAPEKTMDEQVDIVEMLEASDDELLERHGRWYIPERDLRYVRRNALVVLGNVARPDDARAVGILRSVLRGSDGMLRRHAAWAARRMGRGDLLDGLDDDSDPRLREELATPVEVRS
jgi:epoxyqueuosine reductase